MGTSRHGLLNGTGVSLRVVPHVGGAHGRGDIDGWTVPAENVQGSPVDISWHLVNRYS